MGNNNDINAILLLFCYDRGADSKALLSIAYSHSCAVWVANLIEGFTNIFNY